MTDADSARVNFPKVRSRICRRKKPRGGGIVNRRENGAMPMGQAEAGRLRDASLRAFLHQLAAFNKWPLRDYNAAAGCRHCRSRAHLGVAS